jgi:hypothetical protein
MYLCELLAQRLISVTDYLVTLKQQYEGHDHLAIVDQVLERLIHRHPRQRAPGRVHDLAELPPPHGGAIEG